MQSSLPAIVVVVALCAILSVRAQLQDLRLLAEWKEAEYEFPSEAERQRSLDAQEYVPGNGVPIDMDVDYGGQSTPRVFVTVPRFVGGVPITLGTLTKHRNAGGPQIRGYPSYSWNSNAGSNCDGLTSVFRVAIDDCRRLWVLDSGRVGDTQSCAPQLVVFDLDNDQVVRQYKFPAAQFKPGTSLFITPAVDVRDPTPATAYTCPNTMVYMADVNGFGLVVYDFAANRSWRVQNKFLYPSPYAGTFALSGETFDLMDGVFGLALTPRGDDNRKLYMHSLASTSEVAVPLRVLDNATLWEANVEATPRSFAEIGNRGGQATAQAMDANGNLFFGLINPIGLGCWDSQKPYGREAIRVVAQNDQTLQFASGLKVKRNRDGAEELWVSSCRFQKVMTGTMSRDEVNFRIQAVEVARLLGGRERCAGGVGGNAPPTSVGVTFPRY